MGAFALLDHHLSDSCEEAVSGLFGRRGFPAPARFDLGTWQLLLWRKQLLGIPNAIEDGKGRAVFAVGTPVYRGLGFRGTLEALLADSAHEGVDRTELRGAYCVLVADGGAVDIFTDPANMYHVFSTEDGSILSSSMHAIAVGSGRPVRFHRGALLEQLVTGSFCAPQTPLQGVLLLDVLEQKQKRWQGIHFHTPDTGEEPSQWSEGFDACVNHQARVIQDHFSILRGLALEQGASLGLSAGYDSRLVLALAQNAGFPVRAHTFVSEAHRRECAIAQALAMSVGTSCKEIPVRLWEGLDPESIDVNVADVLGYYDGRTNKTQGTFNDVHTRACRIGALDGAGLGLSGHGGELYRNREHLRPGALNFSEWLRYFVIDPCGWESLDGELARKTFVDYLVSAYSRILGRKIVSEFDRHQARRWYAMVWLPFGAGPKLCAENQLSFSLIAFAEKTVLREALRSTPVLGVDGRLEAALIRRVNSGLASFPSSYGHSFDEIPYRMWVRSAAVSAVPHRIRLEIGRRQARRRARISSVAAGKHTEFIEREAINRLKDLGLPLRWNTFLSDRDNRDRAVMLGCFVGHLESSV